jgi:hypothetical protein
VAAPFVVCLLQQLPVEFQTHRDTSAVPRLTELPLQVVSHLRVKPRAASSTQANFGVSAQRSVAA